MPAGIGGTHNVYSCPCRLDVFICLYIFDHFLDLWLVFRHPLGHVAAKSAALIGAGFTLITLITGAFWGKPMWGTWWVWDARLTSVLVLFFIYLGYLAIWTAIEDPLQAGRVSSVLAIVGFVNVPIVKFSVDWWNTLHQPSSVSRFDVPALHSDYLWPLLVMAMGFQLLFFTTARMQTGEFLSDKVRTNQV